MGLELDVEPELLPLPELPVLFFLKVAYGLELSCGEEDIPARNGEDRGELGRIFVIHVTCDNRVTSQSPSLTVHRLHEV